MARNFLTSGGTKKAPNLDAQIAKSAISDRSKITATWNRRARCKVAAESPLSLLKSRVEITTISNRCDFKSLVAWIWKFGHLRRQTKYEPRLRLQPRYSAWQPLSLLHVLIIGLRPWWGLFKELWNARICCVLLKGAATKEVAATASAWLDSSESTAAENLDSKCHWQRHCSERRKYTPKVFAALKKPPSASAGQKRGLVHTKKKILNSRQ